MPFECSKGELFEHGRRYAKFENTIQTASRRGFQIIAYMFNLNVLKRNINVSQSKVSYKPWNQIQRRLIGNRL